MSAQSWWGKLLQFLIGLVFVLVTGAGVFALTPRPKLPSDWANLQKPGDVNALLEVGEPYGVGAGMDWMLLIEIVLNTFMPFRLIFHCTM
jgi:hypothetical protein